MSKHVREKCGKLCISSILSSKRGKTPTKIAYAKFQLNMSKHDGEKCGKLADGDREGRTDRHYHTIIRPV